VNGYADRLDALWAAATAPRADDAPTVASCFAGMGGSLLGYLGAGYREVLAVEHDAHAAACLRLNFGVTVHQGDIGAVRAGALPLAPGELGLLDGSPPCQGFSTLGRRREEDPRSRLFGEFVRLLRAWRPRAFVMENVPGLPRQFPARFAEICAALSGAGYVVTAALVDACAFGAATTRKRLIITGARADLAPAGAGLPAPSARPTTLRDALRPTPGPVIEAPPLTERIRRLALITEPGYDAADAMKLRGGRASYFNLQRPAWDVPCWTIPATVSQSRCGMLHPREQRLMSIGELMRIQGIPDGYQWPPMTTYAHAHHRIGNSVVPLLTEALGAHLRPIAAGAVPVGT
jgi:DNA (cytosine-5)-methyltransferase 1